MTYRTSYQTWWTEDEVTSGLLFDNEKQAVEKADKHDNAVVLMRRQHNQNQDNAWEDEEVEVIKGNHWNAYLDQITDVPVKERRGVR